MYIYSKYSCPASSICLSTACLYLHSSSHLGVHKAVIEEDKPVGGVYHGLGEGQRECFAVTKYAPPRVRICLAHRRVLAPELSGILCGNVYKRLHASIHIQMYFGEAEHMKEKKKMGTKSLTSPPPSNSIHLRPL